MTRKLYINGNWIEGVEQTNIHSPYTGEVVATLSEASSEQMVQAIESANQATIAMRNLSSLERANILFQLVDLFKANFEQAAKIISMESAKPIKYARKEIERTIETYQFAAEEAKRFVGEIVPIDAAKNGHNKFGYTLVEPLGVIGAITPFNFPQNLVAHKVGPAIATGNTIVLKPASQTALSALFLAELLDQTALPKGAFNVVLGQGRVVGDTLIMHQDVKMITFTGSPGVGIQILQKAGLKRTALELGSNAGLIIDEHMNVELIARKCVVGAFSNQGQICISLQRIYVMESLYEAFVEAFIKETQKLIIGDPLEEDTDVSALISKGEAERAKHWLEEAITQGAKLLYGGGLEGTVLTPTILGEVHANMKVSCEEVFAPIVFVNKIQSIQEGIERINNSKYGLQAGIFTSRIKEAFTAAKTLEVGGVVINDIPTFRVDQMPYGGQKQSGIGKEGVKYAMREMTEQKLIIWNDEEGVIV